MKRKYILPLVILLITFSCDKDNFYFTNNKNKTIVIYMIAENSLSSNCHDDLIELLSVKKTIPDDSNLMIYIDDSDNIIQKNNPILIRISNKKADTLKIYSEQNTCNSFVFASILSDIISFSKSNSYSLIMWSHGTGWIPQQNRTIGIDNNHNTYSNNGTEMEIPEMRMALEKTGIHFDWIMFDACFMQCVEVAYELKDLTEYIIASPAEIPAMGAPYDVILPSFFVEDCRESAFDIAQKYFDHYKDNKGLVLSVIDTSKMDDLAVSTSQILQNIPILGEDDGIQRYGLWSKRSLWRPEYYDMASIMNHYLNSSAYDYWNEQMIQAFPLRLCTSKWTTSYNFDATIFDSEHFAGVSMFIPAERYEPYGHNDSIKKTRWWQDVFGIFE